MERSKTNVRTNQWITNKHLAYLLLGVVMVVFSQLLIAPEPYNLLPFAVICGTVFVAATILRPMIGLYLYLVFYLIRPQELFPHVGIMHYPYEKFIAIFVIASIVVHYLVRGRKIELFGLDAPIVLFIGAMLLSVFPAIWVGGAKDHFILIFKSIIVYFFLTRIVNTEFKFKSVVWLYVISVGIIAVSSTYNYYAGQFQVAMGIERASGIAGEEGSHSDPNSMASSLVLGMPFIFYLFKFHGSRILKLVLIGVMLASLWTVILTGSRGGMLGSIIMLGLIAYHSRHRTVALVLAAATIIGFAAIMPEQYVERFASIAEFQNLDDDTGAAHSAQGRIKGLLIGLEILLTRPLTGVGTGCFSTYNYMHHGSWLQPHNLLGQIAGELGLVGLLAFGFFAVKLIRDLRDIRTRALKADRGLSFDRAVATATLISTAMLFFLGLFAHNLYRFNWWIFAGFVAIMTGLERKAIMNESSRTLSAESHTRDRSHDTAASSPR